MKARAKQKVLPKAKRAGESARAAPESLRAKKGARRKSETAPNDSFPIAGIGASAGGLEAFTQLLKHLPADTGMGFVLVQHLDPQHESALTQLLARATAMPVQEVRNNLRVEANHVYVISPNTNLAIASGVLKLEPRPEGHGPHRSIDFFLEALAHDQNDCAIGVILSGTATDGTLGLEAIKAEGGITFAQDESAKYDSMPRSAIAAGCVDFALPPQKIAQELARIAKHPYLHDGVRGAFSSREGAVSAKATTPSREARALPEEDGFKKILLLLRNHCGVDFSLYKSSTIERRISRRMVLNKQNTPADYADFLRHNSKELDALYSDALISVTSFFRNPEAFDALERKVFPKLVAQRERDDPLRVWVPGCSTGQEPYSIAISFAEFSEIAERAPKLQIFATDLNEALLEKARQGIYPRTLAQEISPERLRRFFVEEEGGYRVLKSLRQQVIFARQNLMSDPPFSRMDLIICRNLLIYLEADLQRKIIPAFHYALKPDGFLFLGTSESISDFPELFAAADKKQKIFVKKPGPTPAFRLPLPNERATDPSPGSRVPGPRFALAEGGRGEGDAQREADRIMVSQFAPPGVLINAELQILQFRGATGAYLEPPTGKASFDLLKMARQGLMLPLRAAINQAMRENKAVRRENVRVPRNGASRALNLEVIPLKNLKQPCYLVLFEEAHPMPEQKFISARAPKRAREAPALPRKESGRIADLERELSETRDYLQSIQEEHEAGNEELQASNEEVQSANEELQSINEELETSKEELESANEELTTVNEEMTSRNAELSRLNADLNNLQVSIHTAILLFSRELILRRFTPLAGKLFNLLPADLGRPLGGIRHNLEVPDLERLLAEVIETVTAREREVQDKDGRWYALRARPYLLDNQIDGVVLVLGDIDALKRSEGEIRAARDYAEATLRTIPGPLVILHADLRVSTANEAFYKTFQVTPAATEGRLIYEVGNGQWNIPKLRELLEEIIPQKQAISGFEVTHEFEFIGRRSMLLNARRVDSEKSVPARILLAIEDITLRRRVEQQLIHSQKMESLGTLAGGIAHDFNNILAIILGYATRLEERKAQPKQIPDAIKVIRDAVERGTSLVQQLLSSARQTETHIAALDLNALVRELGGMLGATFPKTIKFILRPKPNLPLLKADRSQIHQVLLNLCVNARDAMPKGGKITIETGVRAGPQLREHFSVATAAHYVLLRVIDTGSGISRQVEPHIFEPFYSTKERSKGTGLGLSVVYGVVNNHHGFVRVGSEHGRGTTFSVYLPLGPETGFAAGAGEELPAPPNDSTRTILFVEDEEMLRALGVMMLQDDGYRVLEARDGVEAVEMFEAHRAEIGLVVCDLGLPQLGGREVFLKMKESKPSVRAIIASGYLEANMRSKMLQDGVSEVIEKPYDFHKLLEKVRSLIGQPENREA
ncbi:MAG TPA: CheR family methyltransferase [Chthoniobacterales bacterium]